MIRIVSISFDKRTKIIMGISIIIAICIMIFNFYNIIIKNENEIDVKNIELENICEFEAIYTVEVNSNKNMNEYKVKENCNLENNVSNIEIENGIILKNDENELVITDKNNTLEYKTPLDFNMDINYIFIGNIIEIYRKLKNNIISGKIEKINEDNFVTYICYFDEKNMNRLEIKMEDNVIVEIVIYDIEDNVKNYIKIDNFVVKK